MCDCEFDADPDDEEVSFHYRRTCEFCGHKWWGLHCPHDGVQNPCGNCGRRPVTVPDPEIPLPTENPGCKPC